MLPLQITRVCLIELCCHREAYYPYYCYTCVYFASSDVLCFVNAILCTVCIHSYLCHFVKLLQTAHNLGGERL